MSREQILKESLPEVYRYPRKWEVVWTYGRSDQKVANQIEERISPYYPELLQVLVPSVKITKGSDTREELATQGYVFLKVAVPSYQFFDAVKIISGVGGFLGSDLSPEDVEKVTKFSKEPVEHYENFEVGDLVRIIEGPLHESKGRIHSLSPFGKILVEIPILGRLVPIPFEECELELQ